MCNLSAGDVISFIEDDGYETRVVTSDGRFVSLKRGDGARNTSLGEDMKKACTNKTFFERVIMKTIEKYGVAAGYFLINRELENMMNEWLC
ncbi:hypothetical protein, partial [Treponema sp. R8-4-B8]